MEAVKVDQHATYADACSSDEQTIVVSDQEGFDRDGRRNLFQVATLLAFAVIGAIIGWFLTNDRPDLAALVGGVLGMIVGTFLSGFVLMLIPRPSASMTLPEIQSKYQRLRQRLRIAGIVFVVFLLALPIVVACFGRDDSLLAWFMCLFWIGVTIGLCLYTRILAYRLREWKYPR